MIKQQSIRGLLTGFGKEQHKTKIYGVTMSHDITTLSIIKSSNCWQKKQINRQTNCNKTKLRHGFEKKQLVKNIYWHHGNTIIWIKWHGQ